MPSKREKKRKVQSNKVRLTHFTNTRIRQIIGWGAVALGIVIISFSVLIALEPSWIRSIPYIGKAFAYAETIIKGPKLPDTAGLYGIDVSKHQGNIHWDEVELRYDMVTRRISKHGTMQAPLTFAIAKATEGITTTDPMFELNKKGIRERNIILGAYHYFSYLSDAKKQAEKYLQVAKLDKGNLVPIIDIEEDGNLIKLLKNKKLTKQKVKEIYNSYASKHGKSKTDGKAWCSETVSAAFIQGESAETKASASYLLTDETSISSPYLE